MQAAEKTGSTLNIRKARPDDCNAIVAIDKQTSGVAKKQYWQGMLDLCSDRRDTEFFLVAEREHKVIGFIMGEIRAWEFGSPSCGWVSAIGVARNKLLEGVGSGLLDALCEYFRLAGVPSVRTMIARQNHELLSFFRSYGMMAGPFLQLELELGGPPAGRKPVRGLSR